MMVQITIGGVEIAYDDGNDDIPAAAYRDDTINSVRLNAINAWMALPTILETDHELNQVDLESLPTEGE